MCCDGSGIIDERYVDVDYAIVTECEGCPACDELLAEIAAEMEAEFQLECMLEAQPMWMGIEAYDTLRRPVLPELPAGFKFISMSKDVA